MNNLCEEREVHPESTYLAQRMTPEVVINEASLIVELAPGTTGCTEEIIRKMRKDAKLVLIEADSDVVHFLKERYGTCNRITIVEANPVHLQETLQTLNIKEVDVIITGLPFVRLGSAKTDTILRETKTVLSETGVLLTFQYTKLRKNHFEEAFGQVRYEREFRNLPPAYLFHCAI